MRKLTTILYRPLGGVHHKDDTEPSPPQPEEGYLFDSEGFAICDSEGFYLDTIE